MIKRFDPYEELDVARGATEREIKSGYRRRSKETHPDVEGGSAKAFERTRAAFLLLTDRRRRKQYDDTGEFEELKPDNERAEALGLIQGIIDQLVKPWFDGGFLDPSKDIRKMDLLGDTEKIIKIQIAEMTKGLPHGQKIAAEYEELAARFSGADAESIRRTFRQLADFHADEVKRVRGKLASAKTALKLLHKIKFRQDMPQEMLGYGYGYSPFGRAFG